MPGITRGIVLQLAKLIPFGPGRRVRSQMAALKHLLGVLIHGPEFENMDRLAAGCLLSPCTKNARPGLASPDPENHDRNEEQRNRQQQTQRSHSDIDSALDPAVDWFEQIVPDLKP